MHLLNGFPRSRGFLSIWRMAVRFRYMITEQANSRLKTLVFWEKYGQAATAEAFGVSRRTLFRWAHALANSGGQLDSLNPSSTAPRRRRLRVVSPAIIQSIITLRTDHPRLGKDKLHALLRIQGYSGSCSTVGRILTDLKRQSRLPQATRLSYYAKTGRLTEHPYPCRPKLRRPAGHRVLEVDTIVRFIDGIKRYVITGIDTQSRMAFAGGYSNHGSASATDFLQKTRLVLPDCPTDTQTDNGSEFAKHFHIAVSELGLHFNTHPRLPKENAHIERFNRTLNEEFIQYNRDLLRDDLPEFNRQLIDWLLWYNTGRPHHALGNVSPLRKLVATLPAKECHMLWTHTRL